MSKPSDYLISLYGERVAQRLQNFDDAEMDESWSGGYDAADAVFGRAAVVDLPNAFGPYDFGGWPVSGDDLTIAMMEMAE